MDGLNNPTLSANYVVGEIPQVLLILSNSEEGG